MLPKLCVLVVVTVAVCVRVSSAVLCYQCNSAYDPRCGDPFDSYSLGQVNCSMKPRLEHLPDLEPTICRKSTQKVFGKVRVIRDCGYLTDASNDSPLCLKRSGTFEVQSYFCSCTSDLCNAAATNLPAFGTVAKMALAVIGAGWLYAQLMAGPPPRRS